ncbi:MAG: glycine reductase [Synergistaceae bacterium]|jgi:hypothetical protein|nr:glycine reductase [Synergistaceae bacterium]
MNKSVEAIIAKTFSDIADGLETGSFGGSPRICVTGLGSEHGEKTVMEGVLLAARGGAKITYIGTTEADGVTTIKATTEAEAHSLMEKMLDAGEADGGVTMHYPFPIGVATVGRAVTPAAGREMYIATTTGAASADRVEGMVLGAVYGTIAAKSCGLAKPSIGILNLDGARQAEIALRRLRENGYDMTFAESSRAGGGCVMRGNDVLLGTPDVLVCDSLTGNILIKILSSYTSGGAYETTGYGYGPGIGEKMDKMALIVSRASGAPVIAGAIAYATQLAKGNLREVARAEFAKVKRAGLMEMRKIMRENVPARNEKIEIPPEETVTEEISGIDVMDIENAATKLWEVGIFARTGMGCTGPVVLVSEKNHERAAVCLRQGGFIA